jgi:hypothetical protein
MKKAGHSMAVKQFASTQHINTDIVRMDEGSRLLNSFAESPRGTTDFTTPAQSPARFSSPSPECIAATTDAYTPFGDTDVTVTVTPKSSGDSSRRSPKAEMLSASQCHSYSSFWGTAKPLDPFSGGKQNQESPSKKPVVNCFMFMKYC